MGAVLPGPQGSRIFVAHSVGFVLMLGHLLVTRALSAAPGAPRHHMQVHWVKDRRESSQLGLRILAFSRFRPCWGTSPSLDSGGVPEASGPDWTVILALKTLGMGLPPLGLRGAGKRESP